MKKYIGYIPAVFFTAFYLMIGITGGSFTMSMVLIWLACFLLPQLCSIKALSGVVFLVRFQLCT